MILGGCGVDDSGREGGERWLFRKVEESAAALVGDLQALWGLELASVLGDRTSEEASAESFWLRVWHLPGAGTSVPFKIKTPIGP